MSGILIYDLISIFRLGVPVFLIFLNYFFSHLIILLVLVYWLIFSVKKVVAYWFLNFNKMGFSLILSLISWLIFSVKKVVTCWFF